MKYREQRKWGLFKHYPESIVSSLSEEEKEEYKPQIIRLQKDLGWDNTEIFHVHTYRCGHAGKATDEEYILRTIDLGATKISFTDHAPFPDNPFRSRMKMEQLPEYLESLNDLKEKYVDKIDVQVGLEIEYLPSYEQYYEELANNEQLDFMMLGQHFYELDDGRYSFGLEDKAEEYIRLANAMIAGMNTGLFSVVAHPDRIFRRQREWDDDIRENAIQIIEAAHRNEIALEQNLSSMQRKNNYWTEFWMLVPEAVKVIKGLDAHFLEELRLW